MKDLSSIVKPAIVNLLQSEVLCTELDETIYASKNNPPYHSSIGTHLRHVLDLFHCVINGVESKVIDLTNRKRGTKVEHDPKEGRTYLLQTIEALRSISCIDPQMEVIIKDDLGAGIEEVPATIAAGLNQAHSHALHHFAMIGYLLHTQGAKLPNQVFGYNPTTPKSNS